MKKPLLRRNEPSKESVYGPEDYIKGAVVERMMQMGDIDTAYIIAAQYMQDGPCDLDYMDPCDLLILSETTGVALADILG